MSLRPSLFQCVMLRDASSDSHQAEPREEASAGSHQEKHPCLPCAHAQSLVHLVLDSHSFCTPCALPAVHYPALRQCQDVQVSCSPSLSPFLSHQGWCVSRAGCPGNMAQSKPPMCPWKGLPCACKSHTANLGVPHGARRQSWEDGDS